MCDTPTWWTSEWRVVYVSLQAGHVKRVWVGWVTTKSTDCGGVRDVAVGSGKASPGWAGSDGLESRSGRASPGISGSEKGIPVRRGLRPS